jgi:hypothetical protein
MSRSKRLKAPLARLGMHLSIASFSRQVSKDVLELHSAT